MRWNLFRGRLPGKIGTIWHSCAAFRRQFITKIKYYKYVEQPISFVMFLTLETQRNAEGLLFRTARMNDPDPGPVLVTTKSTDYGLPWEGVFWGG